MLLLYAKIHEIRTNILLTLRGLLHSIFYPPIPYITILSFMYGVFIGIINTTIDR